MQITVFSGYQVCYAIGAKGIALVAMTATTTAVICNAGKALANVRQETINA